MLYFFLCNALQKKKPRDDSFEYVFLNPYSKPERRHSEGSPSKFFRTPFDTSSINSYLNGSPSNGSRSNGSHSNGSHLNGIDLNNSTNHHIPNTPVSNSPNSSSKPYDKLFGQFGYLTDLVNKSNESKSSDNYKKTPSRAHQYLAQPTEGEIDINFTHESKSSDNYKEQPSLADQYLAQPTKEELDFTDESNQSNQSIEYSRNKPDITTIKGID